MKEVKEINAQLAAITGRAMQTAWPMPYAARSEVCYRDLRGEYDKDRDAGNRKDIMLGGSWCKKNLGSKASKDKKASKGDKKSGLKKAKKLFQHMRTLYQTPFLLATLAGPVMKSFSDLSNAPFTVLLIDALVSRNNFNVVMITICLFFVKLAGGMGLQYSVHVLYRLSMQVRSAMALLLKKKTHPQFTGVKK